MQNIIDKIEECLEEVEGNLVWKAKSHPKSRVKVGDIVKGQDRDGYLKLCICGKHLRAHRVVAYLHGILTSEELFTPSVMVDHIDGDVTNNSPDNLRKASNRQNQLNSYRHREGLEYGVCKTKDGYIVRVDGEYLGFRKTKKEALKLRGSVRYDETRH